MIHAGFRLKAPDELSRTDWQECTARSGSPYSRQDWFRVRMLGGFRTGLGRYIMFSVQIYLDLDGSESEQRYSKRYVST